MSPEVEIIIVEQRGSGPSQVGARAFVNENGLKSGTVGGGKVEARAIELALEIIHKNSSPQQLVTWNLQKDIGMTCGGEVKLFFDLKNDPNWDIAIFGAGHVSQALVPLLCTINCRITCFDTRGEWLEKIPDHSRLKKVRSQNLASEVESLSDQTWLLSLTMGHAQDTPVLLESYNRFKDLPYRGVIGSDQKAKVIKNELKEAGVSFEQLEHLYCPMGLPIGDNTPAQIAISIAAQLLSLKNGSGDKKS